MSGEFLFHIGPEYCKNSSVTYYPEKGSLSNE